MLRLLFLLISFQALADFDWQAHRGGRGLYPENTIKAMKLALKYPVTTLELDVVISKDHQVVVSHEPWMNEETCLSLKGEHLSGKEINLYKLTYKEIKEYDCGSKPHPRFPRQARAKEHKPLLKDLLNQLKESGKMFNIEIKSTPEEEAAGFQPDYKKFSDEVVSLILKLLPVGRFTIQSFDWRVLKFVHEKYPQVKLVALIERPYVPQTVFTELGFNPAVFSPPYELLTAAHVAYFHKLNVKVVPWTVNTPENMNKMIAMHVDGIITDYPDLIQNVPRDSYQSVPDCGAKYNRFENSCIKIPAHAEASEQNPGWVCKRGYLQKRLSCVKIKLPKHAFFLEDGKSWACEEGHKHYRYTCKKN